jgi:hypothetical protein
MRGQSETKRKREGREKGKKLVALAHGFVVQCSGWSRYWEASGEQSPWIGGRSRERKEREMGRGTRRERGAVDSVPFWLFMARGSGGVIGAGGVSSGGRN